MCCPRLWKVVNLFRLSLFWTALLFACVDKEFLWFWFRNGSVTSCGTALGSLLRTQTSRYPCNELSEDPHLCQKGRRKRHAVIECYQPHSSLTGDSRFSSDSRLHRSWTTGSKCSDSPPFSHHLYPPLPIISLSIHLFVHIPFPSCLLIVAAPHHLFLHQAHSSSPQATNFQQRLEAPVGRPPGRSKKTTLNTPSCTSRPVQPKRGFHLADDGAHSSFLNPYKSVGGLRPMV